jgi:hypothetical protein
LDLSTHFKVNAKTLKGDIFTLQLRGHIDFA